MIPDEVETHRGGFYVNSGALEFKKLSNFERPGDELIMPKAKKRALSTTSESGSESDREGKSPSSKSKKKSKIEEKKPKAPTTTATSSSDEQGKAAKKAKKDKSKEPEKIEKKKEPEKAIKTTTVKDMLRAKRDHLLKEQGKVSGSGTATTTDNDEEDGSETASSLAVSESSRDSHPETSAAAAAASTSNEVKLPENLSSEVTQMIQSLQQHAANSTKSSMFDTKTLERLVLIDNESKAISASARVQTFLYLEKHLACSRKTLFDKVKQHRISAFTKRLSGDVGKLREIVAETLPQQNEKYEREKASFEAKKSAGEQVHEPRRKYHWNDTSRQVLSDIAQKIEDLRKAMKTKKFENSREFLELKLKEKVLPLWPEGWIKQKDLDNELEKKRKKEAKAQQANNQTSKPNTSSFTSSAATTTTTNGKPQTQKTENPAKQQPSPTTNGKTPASSPTPSISPPTLQGQPITAAACSVIKRSSDHSISSIIASASPSPPMKITSPIPKPKLIELDKYTNPSDLLKVAQHQEKLNRSDSTDSDCVEIVESFEQSKVQQKTAQSNHNNNRVTRSPSPLPPVPQKKARVDTPPEMVDDMNDKAAGFSLILAGLNSLTVSFKMIIDETFL